MTPGKYITVSPVDLLNVNFEEVFIIVSYCILFLYFILVLMYTIAFSVNFILTTSSLIRYIFFLDFQLLQSDVLHLSTLPSKIAHLYYTDYISKILTKYIFHQINKKYFQTSKLIIKRTNFLNFKTR